MNVDNQYHSSLLDVCNLDPNSSLDHTIDIKSLCSDGCDNFSDTTIGMEGGGSVSDSLGNRSTLKDHIEDCILPLGIAFMTQDNTWSLSPLETDLDLASLEDLPILKGKSIAHHHLKDKGAVFRSLDLETGGEYCGIIHLSAKIFCIENIDTKIHSITSGSIFNKYVKPPDGALWYPRRGSMKSHHHMFLLELESW